MDFDLYNRARQEHGLPPSQFAPGARIGPRQRLNSERITKNRGGRAPKFCPTFRPTRHHKTPQDKTIAGFRPLGLARFLALNAHRLLLYRKVGVLKLHLQRLRLRLTGGQRGSTRTIVWGPLAGLDALALGVRPRLVDQFAPRPAASSFLGPAGRGTPARRGRRIFFFSAGRQGRATKARAATSLPSLVEVGVGSKSYHCAATSYIGKRDRKPRNL